jgi:hypothetical protein
MTKEEAEEVADGMRAAGWREVSLKINDNGKWSVVGEDYEKSRGWLHRRIDEPPKLP